MWGGREKKVETVRKSFFDSKIYCTPRRIQLFIAPHRRNVLPSPENDELP